jgi:hypothetical protein
MPQVVLHLQPVLHSRCEEGPNCEERTGPPGYHPLRRRERIVEPILLYIYIEDDGRIGQRMMSMLRVRILDHYG